jgi:antitoxin MazE
MVTKIQKWGNSQGLRLAKHILEEAKLTVGDDVDVTARDGEIIVTPVKRIRGKYNLRELVSGIPAGYVTNETEWGRPAGKEAW